MISPFPLCNLPRKYNRLHEPEYNHHKPKYNLHEPEYNLHELEYNLHDPVADSDFHCVGVFLALGVYNPDP